MTDITVWYYKDEWMPTAVEPEDFELHHASFSGDTVEDALLHALESFGILNRDKYLNSNMEMSVEAIIEFSNINRDDDEDYHDTWVSSIFILYIQDDLGNYIFEESPKLAEEWKITNALYATIRKDILMENY